MIWNFLRRLFFRIDAEAIHLSIVRLLSLMHRISPALVRMLAGIRVPGALLESERSYRIQVLGMEFLNPVGLAAGFDKNAELVEVLPDLGFGFVEIGTVTPRPQPGNERPRLFRDAATQQIFNRMGFNSLGAEVVASRLKVALPKLPKNFRVGVNLGKNKDTPLEKAHEDYAEAARHFEGLADYLVLNISSPNTPGLRSLQTLESVGRLTRAVREVVAKWQKAPPILLKLAPEIEPVELQDFFQNQTELGIDGWILTNTLGGERNGQVGGWSGSCLTDLSRERLMVGRSLSRSPIISVGGVMDAEEGRRRRRNGADLVQIYSGWVFAGPRLPAQVARLWMIP
jgi:dihydroorotate dehydrogenase